MGGLFVLICEVIIALFISFILADVLADVVDRLFGGGFLAFVVVFLIVFIFSLYTIFTPETQCIEGKLKALTPPGYVCEVE